MTDKQVRVCHVVNAVSTTSVPADIATALEQHTDVSADILAWFNAENFDGSELVGVHELNAPNITLGVDGRSLRRAWDILAEYDVVQTHHNHSGTFAKSIAFLQGTPIVSTEQNNHGGFSRKGLVANALTNVLADDVTCVSETVLDSMRPWERALLNEEHLHVIHNGVNISRVREGVKGDWSVFDVADISEDAVLVATAGRLVQQKGLDTLIEAVSYGREEIEFEVAIAGEGPMREQLEQLSADLDVANAVHFLGKIDRHHAYKLMDEADIYAMPSRWEGFSAAAVEALSVGTPCVFSDIDEFVRPYNDVALFHPVDNSKALANELHRLSSDDNLQSTLTERGRNKAETYSIERVASQYEHLYLQCIQ